MSLVWNSDKQAQVYVTEAISNSLSIEETTLPVNHRKQLHFLQRYLDFVKLIRLFSIDALYIRSYSAYTVAINRAPLASIYSCFDSNLISIYGMIAQF